MAGNTTRAEAARSFFIYVTEPNTDVLRRVAIPADLQVGLEGRPAELQLFGRLALSCLAVDVTASNRGVINVSDGDTVVAVSLVDTPASGRISVRLPPTPRDGQVHFVKDATRTASAVPIDVSPADDALIDGEEVLTLESDGESTLLVWLAGGWHVLSAQASSGGGGGGGGGASTSASYVTVTAEPGLSAERVLTAGTGLKRTDGGANGNVTLFIDDSVVLTLTSSAFTGSILGNLTGTVFGTLSGSVTGSVLASGGLSGSLQQLANGLSYLVAGDNVTITSQSNGQVIVSAAYNPFSLEMSAVPSSTAQNGLNAKKVGGLSYDPATWTQLRSTSTIVFHMLLETTNTSNPASGSLFRYSGTGAPAVLATVVTTSSVMVEREVDVSTFFRPGQAAGVFTVTLNLTTGSTADYATSTAAWLEIRP